MEAQDQELASAEGSDHPRDGLEPRETVCRVWIVGIPRPPSLLGCVYSKRPARALFGMTRIFSIRDTPPTLLGMTSFLLPVSSNVILRRPYGGTGLRISLRRRI